MTIVLDYEILESIILEMTDYDRSKEVSKTQLIEKVRKDCQNTLDRYYVEEKKIIKTEKIIGIIEHLIKFNYIIVNKEDNDKIRLR